MPTREAESPDLPARLRDAADTLLDPAMTPGELLAASHVLRETLGALADWDEDGPETTLETELAGGVAISPLDAARCIPEYQRTSMFLRGTLAAIEAAGAATDGTIEVLYAGCGPLAPLAVALCHRAPRARFWPVDIHQDNVQSVTRLIASLGLGSKFGEVVCGDASTHRWPVSGHVGVAEVMQRGLEKEPQIAVTAHLVEQLGPGALMVPERITLSVQLMDPGVEFLPSGTANLNAMERVRIPVAPLLDLHAGTAASLRDGCAVEFDYAEPSGLHAMVSTHIVVHGDIRLGDYDCSLTIPWLANEIGCSGADRRARIRLSSGAVPRLEASLL